MRLTIHTLPVGLLFEKNKLGTKLTVSVLNNKTIDKMFWSGKGYSRGNELRWKRHAKALSKRTKSRQSPALY